MIIFLPYFSASIQAPQPQKVKKKRRIDIENADLYTYDEKIKANAERLIGNVRLRNNDILMYCDSAYSYRDTNMVDAFGNVHIIRGDTLNLYGNKLNYNGDTKLAKVRGNVKLIDKSITLTTEALDFDLANNIGYYDTGGKIVDTANVLTSIIGRYYSNDDLFYFRDSVVVVNKDFILRADTLKYNSATEVAYIVGPTTITGTKNASVLYSEDGWYDTKKNISELYKASRITNKDMILEGDTLFYDRATGNGRGKHKVRLTDTTNKVVVQGKFGIYNEKSKNAFVTDSAMFMQYGEKDTLYMHADTLSTKPDTSMVKKDTSDIKNNDKKFFMAYRHVRFYKTDMQGECDSLSYQMKDSTIYMFYDPVLWSKKDQMTADNIQYISRNPGPDIAKLEKNAFIVMSEDSIRFNQISGKIIVGQIFDNKLRNVDVNGNAQTLYYLKENNKYTGMNQLISSKIKIHLKENQIDSITFYPKPEGKSIPMNELTPSDTRLGGFVWRESERPISKDDLYPIDEKRKKNAGSGKKPASK